MTNKVAILSDSIACLNQQAISQNEIRIVPATFAFRGKVYRDWVDITPTEAYELFLEDPESFTARTGLTKAGSKKNLINKLLRKDQR